MKKKIRIIAILAIVVLLIASVSVFAEPEEVLETTGATLIAPNPDSTLIAPAPTTEDGPNEIMGTTEIQQLIVPELIATRQLNDNDVYQAGETVTIKGENVNGNVYVAGKDIVIEDELIFGDLFVAGQRIEIKDTARINGNVFVAGQDLFINGQIDRTLYAAGSTIELGKTSVVGYSAYIASNRVVLKGEITRNAFVGGTELTVESTAVINGDLNYTADREGNISKDAKIGNVNYSKVEIKERTTMEIVTDYVIDFAKYFVTVMAVLIFVIKFAKGFEQRTMEKVTFGSFGYGLLWFIVIPAAFVCLLMLRVTSTLAFMLLFLYMLALLLSNAVACIAIAKQIEEAHEKIKLPLGTALMATLTWIIFQIPYVGTLCSIIITLLGFGILLRAAVNTKKEEKAPEVKEETK